MWNSAKYKAWIEEDQRMEYEEDWLAIQEGKYCIVEYGTEIKGHDEKVVLLQYTGITDVNHKEICIGDIIRRWYQEVTFGNNVVEEEVIELVDDIRRLSFLGGDTLSVEILGNMYEDKELLELIK